MSDFVGEEFLITIQCPKCSSINCETYIKEADDDGTWEAGHIHVCPHEIRYRCLACDHIHDVEA